MTGAAEILREIHRLRRHAQNLENEIARGPLLLKAQKAKVTRQEEAIREAQERLKKLKVGIHDKEVTLKSKQQAIAKHERQMNESTSKKEYDALKVEVAHDQQVCSQLEDEILNNMMAVDEAVAQMPALEESLKTAKGEASAFEQSQQARAVGLKEQLEKVREELRQVEAGIPADIRPQYERLISARGEDAMAAVEGRTCTACYTEITAQNYNELKMNQFVVCKSCGRILYLPE